MGSSSHVSSHRGGGGAGWLNEYMAWHEPNRTELAGWLAVCPEACCAIAWYVCLCVCLLSAVADR